MLRSEQENEERKELPKQQESKERLDTHALERAYQTDTH
jgi:hypothetical protein